MNHNTSPTILDVTHVQEALVVWVRSTTVAAHRNQLSRQLSQTRSVFGRYAETSQPAVQRLVEDLRELDGQPASATLIPAPHEFGTTHASKLLPRGARVVGWLDAEGYRGLGDTPQPGHEWLLDQGARLR